MRRCLALFLLAMSSSCSSSSSPSRSFLVTGATEGLGLAAAKQLVKAGHTVLVHGRNAPKVDGVVRSLEASGGRAVGYVADLSSMAQVRQLGSEVAEAWPSLDGLLNNAGSFDGDYTGKRVVTDEGNEYTLAVNVLAPFLLTSLLLPSLRASGSGRVVISSSVSMGEAGSLGDLQLESGYSGHRAYSLSKLCDAMMALEMHARYGAAPRLVFNTMDPGTVDTKMLNAGWGSGAPVSTATRTYEMLTRPEWGERSGVCTCGTDREVNDPELRRKLWDDLVALTGAEWPDA